MSSGNWRPFCLSLNVLRAHKALSNVSPIAFYWSPPELAICGASLVAQCYQGEPLPEVINTMPADPTVPLVLKYHIDEMIAFTKNYQYRVVPL